MERGVPHIVISSIPVSPTLASTLDGFLDLNHTATDTYSGKSLLCLCSSRSTDASHKGEHSNVYATTLPHIKGYFSGVGDMFSALVLAHFDHDKRDLALRHATSCALSTTHAVLAATRVASTAPGFDANETDDEADAADNARRVRRMQRRELRVVDNQACIRNGGATWNMPRWDGFWGRG